MNEEAIQEQYDKVVELLKACRLNEAQTLLGTVLWNCSDPLLANHLEQTRTSYRYMLQYMRQGVDDPERRKLYRQLVATTWEIADHARLSLMDGKSTRRYHVMRRTEFRAAQYDLASLQRVLEAYEDDLAICQLTTDGQGVDGVLQRHEQAVRTLFLSTWCNSDWTVEDATQAEQLLHSETLYINDLCLFTSAVMLSLMECFDVRKLDWLLGAVTHSDILVSQRALVGLAVVLLLHASRLSLYPALSARLSLLDEGGGLGKQLNRIYIELLRSRETEEIDRKMREEIIPEVMKSVKHVRKFDIEESGEENDFNPEWGKVLDDPVLTDKIREMNDLQIEGADVYMSTFAQLKNTSFFREMHNWFYPFDMHHPAIVKLFGFKHNDLNAVLPLVLRSGFFCNSDKYSLCFTISRIPQAQRSVIFNHLKLEEFEENTEKGQYAAALSLYAQRPEVVCNQYIHDLYRFFKLYPYRQEFRDIFKEEPALHRIPVLHEILCKPDLLKSVAEFQLHKEHPTEALELYKELIDQNQADADIFQKTGFCLQKEKRYKEAIAYYKKADILHPDNIWNIRHLATCYRQTRDFSSALEHYKKLEAIQPENHQVLFYAGSCLAELERYEEALQYFFKLDFLESDNVKSWRAIGWCLFLCGKHGQAMKYYEKILAHEPMAVDCLNAGHVAWTTGNTARAAELYAQASAKCDSPETFREMFEKDKETLVRQGIDEKDIPLMIDMAIGC